MVSLAIILLKNAMNVFKNSIHPTIHPTIHPSKAFFLAYCAWWVVTTTKWFKLVGLGGYSGRYWFTDSSE
jgi:hypothetical protein